MRSSSSKVLRIQCKMRGFSSKMLKISCNVRGSSSIQFPSATYTVSNEKSTLRNVHIPCEIRASIFQNLAKQYTPKGDKQSKRATTSNPTNNHNNQRYSIRTHQKRKGTVQEARTPYFLVGGLEHDWIMTFQKQLGISFHPN